MDYVRWISLHGYETHQKRLICAPKAAVIVAIENTFMVGALSNLVSCSNTPATTSNITDTTIRLVNFWSFC